MKTPNPWFFAAIIASSGCALVSGLNDFEIVEPTGAGGQGGSGSSTSAGGSGMSGGGSSVSMYSTIGGTVSGLLGKGLIVRNNGADDLQLGMNGSFAFPAKVPADNGYDVTVSSNPTTPSQTCSVQNGSGIAAGQNITDVQIDCVTNAFAVGGLVVGLGGGGLVLTNNGGDDLPVDSAGPFQFGALVSSGDPYKIEVKTQPSPGGGGPCTVSGGSGIVGNADVNSVIVNCAAGTYTVGGTISGLVGTIVLQQNGADDLVLTADGDFAFAQTLAPGAMYNVTVLTQPMYPPRSQHCVVANATGTMGAANVTNVQIVCTINSYSVGGTASGLTGSLVLANNGGDLLTLPQSGAFSFPTLVQSGDAYGVSVVTPPSGQTCTVLNGSGTVTNAVINDIAVECAASSPNQGILCNGTYCDPDTLLCCQKSGFYSCATKCNGAGATPYRCDSASDCATGLICCGAMAGMTVLSTSCVDPVQCFAPKAFFCNPKDPAPCPNGGSCTSTNDPPGYFRCF